MEWVGKKYIIPSVSFGATRNMQFESLDQTHKKNIKLKPGSLLVQREQVREFWNTKLLDNGEATFYNLIFNRLYPLEKNLIPNVKNL